MPDEVSGVSESGGLLKDWTAERNASINGGNAVIDMEDFYKLLAAQLRYQDMDNPMDTSEMMAQMVQSQMIQAITEMSQMSYITYAASFAGKEVTLAEVNSNGQYTNELTTGVVTGVGLTDSPPSLYVNGKRYALSQLVTVGNTTLTEGSEGTEKPGDKDDPAIKDPDKEEDKEDEKDPDKVDPENPDKVDPDNPEDKVDGSDKAPDGSNPNESVDSSDENADIGDPDAGNKDGDENPVPPAENA